LVLLVVALSLWLGAQTSPNAQTQTQQPQTQQQPGVAQPSAPATDAPNQPGNTVQVPAQQQGQQGQAPAGEQNGVYIFRVKSEEVALHATVIDDKHRLVNGLSKADFTVFENGQPQQIRSFDRRDVPVAVGIVIDNSGSMREKRPSVNKAALNFVRSSNPNDEVFIVNFNDEPFLDQDFTNNVSLLQEALDKVDTRGGTALYDAVFASADHLAKVARKEKKVLLVVTDGEDNESRMSLEQAIRAVQDENGPTIYTIGILGEEGHQRRSRRALESLSVQTGGVAFFPRNLEEVDEISREVARDIRNQYSLTYKPTNPRSNGGYRTVKVVAHAPGYRDLQVRTRSGYFASDQSAAAAKSR
jgi:Ca-activated chloride channel homolog